MKAAVRAAVGPFFEELGLEGCTRIDALVMGMNTAFDLEVRQDCPKARMVYDLFPYGGQLWPKTY